MNSSKPAIVIVAYNRPNSLIRLLSSLKKAYYPDNSIKLIISIDKAENNQDVLAVANDFFWEFGDKYVVYQEKNLGLRSHVLKCGDYTNEYGAIIMLEDDLYVSPNFYTYALQALDFSTDKLKIAGISLYNHQLNVHNNKNFKPIEDGYDNWFFQFASSWGQAWNKKQWDSFKTWYLDRPPIHSNTDIPSFVRGWSEKSWLKYFIAFLIIKDYYFIYPKISLTTNFSDTGTHVIEDNTVFQTPLLNAYDKKFVFSTLNESKAIYDAFYENSILAEHLDVPKKDLCVDLYGYKNIGDFLSHRYILTSQNLNYKIIKQFGCSLKPVDANIIEQIDGDDLYLYDVTIKENNRFTADKSYRRLIYNFKFITIHETRVILMKLLKAKIKRGLKKVF